MICPECGSVIDDEQLYCNNCGKEIQYVPEFEPVIEQRISNSLPEIDQEYDDIDPDLVDLSSEFTNADNKESHEEYYNESLESEEFSEDYVEEVLENGYYDENGDFILFESDGELSQEELLDESDYIEEDYTDDGYIEEDYIDDDSEYYDSEYEDENSLDDDADYDEEYDDYEDDDYLYDDDDYLYDDDYLDDFDEEYDGDEDDEYDTFVERIKYFFSKPKNIIMTVLIVACIVFAVLYGVRYVKDFSKNMIENNSYSHQATLARQAALAGDYENATSYMERALALNSSDPSMKYDLAQYYFKNDESEKAILMLWEIIYGKENGYENAYSLMIDFYIENNDYVMIKNILDHCESSAIINRYKNYLANMPEFSDPEGTYEDMVYLKLSSIAAGTIYYTTDGTEPTMDSMVYVEPIPLELGKYEIQAFFVNSYGIASPVAKKNYTIDIRVPDAPTILLEDGDYDTPELIEVEVQKFCTVYYTTDGTTPNKESNEYTGPIPMPIGPSHFTFVAYSQEGISGDLSEANYYLIIESEIQIAEILEHIRYYNLNMGRTSNLEGQMTNSSSYLSYTVSSAISIDEKVYYIIIENMLDMNQVSMKTGTMYLADAETGDIYKGSKEEETNLPIVGQLIGPELYTPIVATPEPEQEASVSEDVIY